MKTHEQLFVILLIALISMSLSGCLGGTNPQQAGPRQVEVTFIVQPIFPDTYVLGNFINAPWVYICPTNSPTQGRWYRTTLVDKTTAELKINMNSNQDYIIRAMEQVNRGDCMCERFSEKYRLDPNDYVDKKAHLKVYGTTYTFEIFTYSKTPKNPVSDVDIRISYSKASKVFLDNESIGKTDRDGYIKYEVSLPHRKGIFGVEAFDHKTGRRIGKSELLAYSQIEIYGSTRIKIDVSSSGPVLSGGGADRPSYQVVDPNY